MNVYINKIAKFMPQKAIENDEMEEYLGKIAGKNSRARKIILKSNGIKQRYYVLEKGTQKALFSNAELTAKAISNLDFNLEDLDVLSCGTTSPDQLLPNHTLMTQGILGIDEIETINPAGICLSGMNALKYAYLSIKSGEAKNAISTGSETASVALCAKNYEKESDILELEEKGYLAFEKDFLRWMLSDGAGAMLLQDKPNPKNKLSLKIDWIEIVSYAGSMPTCMYCGLDLSDNKPKGWRHFSQDEIMEKSILSLHQDVKLLNDNVIDYTVTKPISKIMKKRNLKTEDIDYFLPHYSSLFFRDKVYEGLKKANFEIPFEKWFTNLPKFGNTGSASMYIMLEELFNSSKLKSGQKILCYIPESGRFSTCFMLLEVVG